MKYWFIWFLVWGVSAIALAGENEPLRAAERLEYVVDSLSREALHEAEEATDPRERRKFLELGEEAGEVRRSLQYRIVRELEQGTALEEVARNFEAIRPEINFLQRLSQALRVVPHAIQRLVDDMLHHTRELYRVLNGGSQGGVTANCKMTVEPDIFTGPKTFVECSFRGKNLVKWEVLLNVGTTKLTGHLYPELMDQHITTEKVRAGLWPKYEVFVTDRQGRRTLVAKN